MSSPEPEFQSVNSASLQLSPKLPLAHELDLGVSIPTREIWVCQEICSDFGGWFVQIFNYLLSLNDYPVVIWLNTNGGDVESAFAYYDVVRASPVPVYVVGFGSVCSAGVIMLAAGTRGCRMVTESCSLMIHEASGFGPSEDLKYSEAKSRRAQEDWFPKAMHMMLANCCGHEEKDAKYWARIMAKPEYWLLGGQAIVDDEIADGIFSFDKLPESTRMGRREWVTVPRKYGDEE